MELHHLKIFAAVYKQRSFTKASERLHISQPTISEHIKNLEQELDCRLFDRLGRTIVPTRKAEWLYPKVVKIMEDLVQLRAELAGAGEEIGGELVIGASTIPGVYLLPRLAGQFKQRYPRVSFEVRNEDSRKISEMVCDHELLCGVVGAKMESRQLQYQPLLEDELVLVGSPELLSAPAITPNQLYELPLLSREQGSGTRQCVEGFLREAGVDLGRLPKVATLGSSTAVKEAAKAKLGVAILSKLAVQEEILSGALREVAISGLTMRRSFYLIALRKRTLPPTYQAFWEFISEAAGR